MASRVGHGYSMIQKLKKKMIVVQYRLDVYVYRGEGKHGVKTAEYLNN